MNNSDLNFRVGGNKRNYTLKNEIIHYKMKLYIKKWNYTLKNEIIH